LTDCLVDLARPLEGAPQPGAYLHAPLLAGHHALWQPAQGFAAGQMQLGAFEGTPSPLPCHLFLLLREGEAGLRQADGQETVLRPGQAILLPRGWAGVWRNTAGSAFTFVHLTGEAPRSPPHAVLLPADALLQPSAGPSEALLDSPAPVARSHLAFEDSTGQLEAGIWEATPYRRRLHVFGHDELMVLLEGRVRITDAAGRFSDFGPGDCFMVARGKGWAWQSEGLVKKFFCSFHPG
jgi:uncharacterized cupin superfamily protein